jgi:transmembrane protein TMEM260 (protein O-mannosyltransferase)
MRNRLPALTIALGGLIFYSLTSYPFPDWLDSPELITAAYRLGIFHPPGSPLAVLTGHLFVLWPFTSAGLALLSFSAVFAAGSLYVLIRILDDYWRKFGPAKPIIKWIVILTCVTGLGLSKGLWSQATRCEVYTLGLLLFLCSMRELISLVVIQAEDIHHGNIQRFFAFLGMGIAVHPLIALTALPATIVLFLSRDVRARVLSIGSVSQSAIFFVLGMAPLFVLPLMVHGPQDFRWADPTSLSGWIETISGTAFSPSFGSSPAGSMGTIWPTLLTIIEGVGVWFVVIGLVGIYLLIRTNLRLALLLVIPGLASALSLILQRSVRIDNPDVSGYALPAICCFFIIAIFGLVQAAQLLSKATPKAIWIIAGLATALLGAQFCSTITKYNRSGCQAGRQLAVGTISSLPPKAIVIEGDFNMVFMLDYLQAVENLRRDVQIFYLKDLDNPRMRMALAAYDPAVEPALPVADDLNRQSLKGLLEQNPLLIGPGPHLNETSLRPLLPLGLLWLVADDNTPLKNDWHPQQAETLTYLSLPTCTTGEPIDSRTADVITWHAYWQAIGASRLGHNVLAANRLALANCSSPQDQTIAETARRFSLAMPQDCLPTPANNKAPETVAAQTRNHDGRPSLPRAALLFVGLMIWFVSLTGWRQKQNYFTIRIAVCLAGFFAVLSGLLFW